MRLESLSTQLRQFLAHSVQTHALRGLKIGWRLTLKINERREKNWGTIGAPGKFLSSGKKYGEHLSAGKKSGETFERREKPGEKFERREKF